MSKTIELPFSPEDVRRAASVADVKTVETMFLGGMLSAKIDAHGVRITPGHLVAIAGLLLTLAAEEQGGAR